MTSAKPAYLIGRDFISISFNSTPVTLYASDARFTQVLDIIKREAWGELDKALNTAKAIVKYFAGKVQVYDGEVHYDDQVCVNAVSSKILEFMRDGLPPMALVRFLDRLMLNPSKRSIEQLYGYLELYRLPITDEGTFLAMKAVSAAFKDKYTGKVSHDVGDKPFMPRESCNANDTVACAASFHCGNVEYVMSYGSGVGDQAVLVEVDPANVVSCPSDCTWQKLRVCGYNVIKRLGLVKDLVPFDSSYAPKTSQAADLFETDATGLVDVTTCVDGEERLIPGVLVTLDDGGEPCVVLANQTDEVKDTLNGLNEVKPTVIKADSIKRIIKSVRDAYGRFKSSKRKKAAPYKQPKRLKNGRFAAKRKR